VSTKIWVYCQQDIRNIIYSELFYHAVDALIHEQMKINLPLRFSICLLAVGVLTQALASESPKTATLEADEKGTMDISDLPGKRTIRIQVQKL
jgi:hypothetical protein